MAWDQRVQDGAEDDVLSPVIMAPYTYQDTVLPTISWVLQSQLDGRHTFMKFSTISRKFITTCVQYQPNLTIYI